MANSLGSHKLNLLRRDRHDPRKAFRYFSDFTNMAIDDTTNDPIEFEIVQDAGATLLIGSADKRGGWLNVVCDGDDNDECYAATHCEAFIFNTTDELFFECEVSSTLTTDAQYGWVIGLSSVVAANTLVDDTMAIVATFDGAVFHYLPAANVAFTTSNAATQTQTAAAYTWTDGDTVRLGFFYDPNDGVTAKVMPVVNGVEGTSHDLTISGLEEMHILAGVKAGSTNEQTLEVDWIECIQRRNATTDIDDLQV